MKLISMQQFVLNETKSTTTLTLSESFQKCVTYANFLNQPLKLEMFVPVDENGNVLEEKFVENYQTDFGLYSDFEKYNKEYYKAKEKVLFEGIDLDTAKYHCNRNVRTIEYFTSFNVELTPNAIKQLGL